MVLPIEEVAKDVEERVSPETRKNLISKQGFSTQLVFRPGIEKLRIPVIRY